MFEGTVRIHGVLDMPRDDSGTSIERLDYPASVPDHVQERVRRFTTMFLERVGFDNGCFNSEFMWNPRSDELRMIEVNTRISQSHSELFIKVDGVSNHEVALDVALGSQPSMPAGEGPDAVAAQCKVFHDQDAVVMRVPTSSEVSALQKKFDGLLYTPKVAVGDVLSELSSQDSYRYAIAEFYIGADSHQRLDELHREIADELIFEFDTPFRSERIAYGFAAHPAIRRVMRGEHLHPAARWAPSGRTPMDPRRTRVGTGAGNRRLYSVQETRSHPRT